MTSRLSGIPLHVLLDERCTAGDRELLRGMSSDEWNDLVDLGDRHRVMSSIHRRMQEPALAELVPPGIRDEVAQRNSKGRKASLGIRLQLPVILGTFEKWRIPVIALKGAHLAFQVYPDPIDRPMIDIDLMVRPADIARVIEMLGSIEYRPYEFADALFLPDFDVHQHLAPFVRAGWPTIEIHRSLASAGDGITIPLEELWGRARTAAFGDSTALVLSPEDLFLHVCVHIAHQHQFRIGLRSVQDIPAIVSHFGETFSWRRFVDASVASGAGRACYYALAVADALVGVDVPPDIMSELRPCDASTDKVDVMAWYLMESMRPAAPVVAQALRRADGVGAVAKAVAQMMFPTPGRMRLLYHLPKGDLRLPLYYAYRPLDLLVRRGRFVLELLLPGSRARSALTLDAAVAAISRALASRS